LNANDFGLYLKRLRNNRGLTLTQLGDLIGYSNPYLSQIETGKKGIPSPEFLKKLSKGLNVDLNDLMFTAGYIEGEEAKYITNVVTRASEVYVIDDIINAAYLPTKFFYNDEELDLSTKLLIADVLRALMNSNKKYTSSDERKKILLNLINTVLE